jgi:hypothetical protein
LKEEEEARAGASTGVKVFWKAAPSP